jgi:hypothetical protein
MKHCYSCKTEKEESDFYTNRSKKDGLSSECKVCSRSKAKIYHHANPVKVKDGSRKRRYGIDNNDYDLMLASQDGKCAICTTLAEDSPKKQLFIDHCHSSGKVRGLLCHHCNFVIGQAKDDIEVLKNAIKYLRNYHEKV